MKSKIKLALQIAAGLLMLWGLKPLVLLAFGTTTTGVIEQIDGKDVTTEMERRVRQVQRPTGKFLVDTHVTYRFDVPPTVDQELQRLSKAPIRTGVRGDDVLYGRTTHPQFTDHDAGDALRILFLRAYPDFNAAYQPNSLRTLGVMRLLGGGVLLVVAWFVTLGDKKGAAKRPAPPAPNPATP